MKRFRIAMSAMLAAVAMCASGLLLAQQTQAQDRGVTPLEYNTNRFGSDYHSSATRSPEACRAMCERDGRCRAFTYVRPGIQGPQAMCWLKDAAPQARAEDCCISGVPRRAAMTPLPAAPLRLEYGVNRFGSDIHSAPVRNPEQCAAMCRANGDCRSFTFVRAGVQGPQAMCWLKNEIPEPANDDCCTSGVIR